MKPNNLWNRFRLSDNQKPNFDRLKLHFENGIDCDLRKRFMDLAKWLRKAYSFPVVLNIYILNTERVRLGNGKNAYGSFKWFNNRTPVIKIPSAVEEETRQKYSGEEITEMIFSSLIHEITHYFQWIEKSEQPNAVSERQANYYRYRILDEFYRTHTIK